MLAVEIGKVQKNNISITEYGYEETPMLEVKPHVYRYFVQSGITGFYATQQELMDLYTLLNYYINIEDFSECKLKIGGEDVAI